PRFDFFSIWTWSLSCLTSVLLSSARAVAASSAMPATAQAILVMANTSDEKLYPSAQPGNERAVARSAWAPRMLRAHDRIESPIPLVERRLCGDAARWLLRHRASTAHPVEQ